MVDIAPPSANAVSRPTIVLAERLADFARMLSIYPARSVRVQAGLATLVAQVRATCAAMTEAPEIVFSGGSLILDGEQIELRKGSALAWLEERIRKAALQGVMFSADVSGAALTDFASRLLELFAQRDLKRSFEEMWPETYEGLELLDLRFDGYFDNAAAGRRLGRLAERGGTQRGGAEEGLREVALLLSRHPKVKEQMLRLPDHLEEREEEEETRRIDVLSRIAALLPHDVLEDYEEAASTTALILEELRHRLGTEEEQEESSLGAFSDEAMLNQMVLATSQGLLGSRAPTSREIAERLAAKAKEAAEKQEAEPEKRATSARASDDAVQDDFELLLEDLEHLPPPMTLTFTERNAESRPEQIGICLHFTQGADREESKAAAGMLIDLLNQAAPSELVPLRDHLDATHAADPLGYQKLTELLRANHLVHLLRDCGFLVADRLVMDFPRNFGTFLECLDPERKADAEELARICEAVGSYRIQKAADDLVEVHGILEPDRARHILDTQSPSVLPMLKVVLECGGQRLFPPAVAALKRLRTDAEEACLLYIWEEPAGLPVSYLRALADPHMSADDLETLYPFISAQICRYLRATREREDLEKRRIYAIRHLDRFFTMEAVQLLQDLIKGRKYGFIARESRAVREAARQVLTTRQWKEWKDV